jgi:hypothetical protein
MLAESDVQCSEAVQTSNAGVFQEHLKRRSVARIVCCDFRGFGELVKIDHEPLIKRSGCFSLLEGCMNTVLRLRSRHFHSRTPYCNQ